MNTLSWLIYAAEVSDRASGVFVFLALMFGLGGIPVIGMLFAAWVDKYGPIKSGIGPFTALVAYLMLETAFLTGAVGLPSKATIYMIAASEAGEQIVTSPDAIEMMGDLKAIIKKRLKDELEAK